MLKPANWEVIFIMTGNWKRLSHNILFIVLRSTICVLYVYNNAYYTSTTCVLLSPNLHYNLSDVKSNYPIRNSDVLLYLEQQAVCLMCHALDQDNKMGYFAHGLSQFFWEIHANLQL